MRILVADDDDSIRSLMGELLTQEGHSVALAATAEAALGLTRAESWDLLIVDTFGRADYRSTGGSGQLLQELTATAPVILCTARSWAMGATASELGVAAILPKPFDIDALLERVRVAGTRR